MDPLTRRAVDRRFARQHSAASLGQLLSDGLTYAEWRWQVGTGAWLLVGQQVVRVAAAAESWHQSAVAACLTVPGAVASRRTAGALWGFAGSRRGLIEVTVPRWERRHRVAFRVHETLDLADVDRARIDGIPVTNPVRTLIDLAAVLPIERLEEAFDDSERRRLLTPIDVEVRFLELARRGRPGIARMRQVIAHRTGNLPDSRFERRVTRLFTAAGLPRPELQHELRCPDGVIVHIDVSYPSSRLAIEPEGERWHGATRRQVDMTRQNQIALLGWTVLRFSWRDLVERPGWIVACVRAALERSCVA